MAVPVIPEKKVERVVEDPALPLREKVPVEELFEVPVRPDLPGVALPKAPVVAPGKPPIKP